MDCKITKYLLTPALLMLSLVSSAAEFEVQSFKRAPKDLAAVRHSRTDINGKSCAIIKVFTDLSQVRFESNMGFTGDVVQETGEYWLYVSPGERRIRFIKEGFVPLAFDIPTKIRPSEVYHLVLRKKTGMEYENGRGSITIHSEPSGAEVRIDGYPDVKKHTPCSFDNYRVGTYRFILTSLRYKKLDTLLSIKENTHNQKLFRLTPSWSNLILNSNINNTRFAINDKDVGKSKTLKLKGKEEAPEAGEAKITADHPQYFSKTKTKQLKPGKTTAIDFNLRPRTGSLKVSSSPAKSGVYLNGDFNGYTPLEKDPLIVGNYDLKIKKRGYVTYQSDFNLKTGQNKKVKASLKDKKMVQIKTKPSEARVYIDKKFVGKSPVKIPLGLKQHWLKIRKEDYETHEESFEVNENTNTVFQPLKKQKQKVKISSQPVKGTVTINGKECGETPVDTLLRPGKYRLTIDRWGYREISRRLKVRERSKNKSYRIKPNSFMAFGYNYGMRSEGFKFRIGGDHVALGFDVVELPTYNKDASVDKPLGMLDESSHPEYLREIGVMTKKVQREDSKTAGQGWTLSLGYMFYYPLPLTIYGGYGWRTFESYRTIYEVKQDFTDDLNIHHQEGETVVSPASEKTYDSWVIGVQLFIRTGKTWGIMLAADHWVEKEPFISENWIYSAGLFFNMNAK